jgi:hypothetical protein
MVLTPAPVMPAPYPGTGQGRDRRRQGRRSTARRVALWRFEILVGSLVMLALVAVFTDWPSPAPTRHMPPGITLIRSGLLAADPFRSATPMGNLQDRYVFNGSAGPGIGWVRSSGSGLDVGVHAHRGWAGWFAVTIHAAGTASVWHAEVARPSTALPHASGEAVFAVQSASTQQNSSINYVVVSALVEHGRRTWQVGAAHGFTANAVTDILWRTPNFDAPSTLPVTIRTDGRHRLSVWLGDRLVFRGDKLDLHDPPPFQAYLEVQANDEPYVARFNDFWIADAEPLVVTGITPGARVDLRITDRVLSSVANRNGRASLTIPPFEAVGTATLTVRQGSVLRRFKDLQYAGGDVLQVMPVKPE